jgi:uncharacterized heparinase superfamily protein
MVATAAPRRVFCVFEHKYRSRAVADEVVSGRFPIQGRTIELGVEPDWIGALLPADCEWRLEWSKFYYGLDLAAAAEQTGDRKYAVAWQRLVDSWIAQVPIDHDPSDVIGRRIQNWVYAWSRFADCVDLESSAPRFEARLAASLKAQVAYLRQHLTREGNHRTLELYALFIAALALPDIDADGRLLQFAIDALDENLVADVLPDGVQRERSTHYHHVVLRSFVGLLVNARRFAISLPSGFEARVERACEFSLHCHRPDGSIPALSDSDSGSYLDLLEAAGDLFQRPDFTYVATRGRRGAPPRLTSASFSDGGYFIQRSGWGGEGRPITDERYLIFDCGAIGDGGHGHYDALNVEIAAEGAPLVIDPGRYTYCDDPPHWRRWFKSSAAHNTVTVDGLDQTPYRRGKPKSEGARARLRQRATGAALDLLWGEVESPLYDVIHRRRILFVANEYWLIEDELDADDAHRYDLRFHLTPDQQIIALDVTPSGWHARTPRVSLIFAGDANARVEPGWVSAEYGVKRAAPVVTFTRDGGCRARFVTLVAPVGPDNRLRPDLQVRFGAQLGVADVTRVSNRDVHDRIAWTLDGAPRPTADGLRVAIASWVRCSRACAPREVTLSPADVVLQGPTASDGAGR